MCILFLQIMSNLLNYNQNVKKKVARKKPGLLTRPGFFIKDKE